MLFTIGLTLAFGIGLALWILVASWLGPLCVPLLFVGALGVFALCNRIATGHNTPDDAQ
jgi:hypothetical protein